MNVMPSLAGGQMRGDRKELRFAAWIASALGDGTARHEVRGAPLRHPCHQCGAARLQRLAGSGLVAEPLQHLGISAPMSAGWPA